MIDDVLLVLNEAVTNAIRHGSPGGAPIEISVELQGDWIDIRVRDHGPTPKLPRLPAEPPAGMVTGGRGLWLIRQLVDEVRLRRVGEGTLLWARCRVPPVAGLVAEHGASTAL